MKNSLTAVCLFCLMLGNAQTNIHASLRVYAYYKIYIPGMQRVDVDGRKINPKTFTERFIYAEVKKGEKVLDADVFINGLKSDVFELKQENNIVNIGREKRNGKDVILTAKKGYQFLLIKLKKQHSAETITEIKTRLHLRSKSYSITVKKETELEAYDMN
jgi:hypothetical protein